MYSRVIIVRVNCRKKLLGTPSYSGYRVLPAVPCRQLVLVDLTRVFPMYSVSQAQNSLLLTRFQWVFRKGRLCRDNAGYRYSAASRMQIITSYMYLHLPQNYGANSVGLYLKGIFHSYSCMKIFAMTFDAMTPKDRSTHNGPWSGGYSGLRYFVIKVQIPRIMMCS